MMMAVLEMRKQRSRRLCDVGNDESMTPARWTSAKFVRRQLRIVLDNGCNPDAEPEDNKTDEDLIISHNGSFLMIRPALGSMSRTDAIAILNRSQLLARPPAAELAFCSAGAAGCSRLEKLLRQDGRLGISKGSQFLPGPCHHCPFGKTRISYRLLSEKEITANTHGQTLVTLLQNTLLTCLIRKSTQSRK